MRNPLIVISLCFAFALGTPLSAQADFTDGFTAFTKGDYATALKEWKPLAELGHADAQYNLGVMYEKGRGVTQDYKEAFKWYRLAANQGVANAQFNLGVMYDTGKGATQDHKEAVRWWRLAAKQGIAEAQYNLGVMYRTGSGVALNNVQAHMWFNISATSGFADARIGRDHIEKKMTPSQIANAQKLAREWIKKHQK